MPGTEQMCADRDQEAGTSTFNVSTFNNQWEKKVKKSDQRKWSECNKNLYRTKQVENQHLILSQLDSFTYNKTSKMNNFD